MKKIVVLIIAIFSVTTLVAQELRCNVTVSAQRIQGANRQLFRTMQADVYEFMNNRKWTEHVYTYDEKIRCNILNPARRANFIR
jgi:cytochrome c-type biogenesis protein CcmH/NrfF